MGRAGAKVDDTSGETTSGADGCLTGTVSEMTVTPTEMRGLLLAVALTVEAKLKETVKAAERGAKLVQATLNSEKYILAIYTLVWTTK